MDWSKGLSASYEGYFVDPLTWKDTEKIQVINGSISKSESDLRESADITVSGYEQDRERWIRIYLNARQISDSYRGAIFTGLISAPGKDFEGSIETNTLRCYSVLKPASDILLPKGYYVPYSTNITNILKSLLSVVRGVPIEIIGTPPTLSQTIIAESGETKLSMVDKILYYIGWRMHIKGDGTIIISEMSQDPVAYFNAVNFDYLETKVNIENDWFDRPNVFRAVQGEFSAIAKDENLDSPLSIQNRGREVWLEESNCTPNIGESLAQYAKRRLETEQQVNISASYSRRFNPDVNVSDIVLMNYPEQNLNGLFYVSSQTVTIGYSPTVSEVVYKL